MKLDLIIPHLLTAPPGTGDLPSCKLLETLLARSVVHNAENYYFAQLFSLVNLPEKISPAWLSSMADGYHHANIYLRADPVHFQALTDHALLLDAQSLNIQAEEAAQLVAAFNAHFFTDGIQLHANQMQRWYIQFRQNIDVNTTPITQAIGRNVRHFLPTGNDAIRWRKILNETQMLFHAHAVNQQREDAGQRAINSLWLWGEGGRELAGVDYSAPIYADEIVARGVASLVNAPCKSVHDWLQAPDAGLLVLDDLITAASYGDAESWLSAFENICQNVLPIVFNAVRTGRIKQVALYPADGRCFTFNSSDLNKFWRLRKPLKHWIRYDS